MTVTLPGVLFLALTGCFGWLAPATPTPPPVDPQPTATPTPTPPPTDVTPPPESDCGDAVDNDDDTLVDCADPDCADDPICPLFPPDTLVYTFDDDDWRAACRELAQETVAETVTCDDGTVITVEAASAVQNEIDCVTAYLDNDFGPTCTLTWADLVTLRDASAADYCDNLSSPEVERLLACYGFDPITPSPTCEVVSDVFPANGSTGVYHRTPMRWTFSDEDPTASISVTDPGGTSIAGTGRWENDVYVWEPTTPLSPSTTYATTLTWCSGVDSVSTTFTTSAVGSTTVPANLVGKTYRFDFNDSDLQVLSGAASSITLGLLDQELLLGVETADTAQVSFLVGLSDASTPTAQDVCVETGETASTFAANPFFATTSSGIPLDDLTLDGQFSGSFTPDGTGIAGLRLEASLDTRVLLTPSDPPDQYCQLVAAFGTSCEPCPDGTGTFCLPLDLYLPHADQVTGLTLVDSDGTDPVCP